MENTQFYHTSGVLYFRENAQTDIQDLGLAFFGEEDYSPIIVMSTSDDLSPDFNEMSVNIPDMKNGFICSNISNKEKDSMMIVDKEVATATGHDCIGKGNNNGVTKIYR